MQIAREFIGNYWLEVEAVFLNLLMKNPMELQDSVMLNRWTFLGVMEESGQVYLH